MIYIAGITERSGTNWLINLIDGHPKCKKGLAEEDNFTRYGDHLIQYAEDIRGAWGEDATATRAEMDKLVLRAFGRGMQRVLQIDAYDSFDESRLDAADDPSEWPSMDKRIVTKTPSVANIDHFFEVFPDAYLVILVRDGRSVVESAMRAFDRSFDTMARLWRNSARSILKFADEQNHSSSYVILRYEDLFRDTKSELRKLFDFLCLDHASYDFEAAVESPVYGSSTYGREEVGGEWNWKSVEKEDDFDPLRRWEEWSATRHDRFNWLAQDELEAFGYVPVGTGRSVGRKARFAYWSLREKISYATRRVRRGIGRRLI